MSEELLRQSIAQVAPLVRRRHVSPVELVSAALRRTEALNPRLNAFITVTADAALEEARAAEKEIARGKYRGPLHGIPISIKDMFATRGVRTTAGSKVLADWVPDIDAAAVCRLRAAGAISIGKTNMHEFAYGVTNDNPHYGPARDPWDPKKVPGGSSGGSGVAVAAAMGFASLGSDTGGSIRIPSALCGTVGLKPTYGRVTRQGAIPLAWSIDHVGPLAKSVEDAAIMLQALAGAEGGDDTAADAEVPDYRRELRKAISGLRIGVPRAYFYENVDPKILATVEAAIGELRRLHANVQEVEIPRLENCSAMEAHITLAEATSYHEKHLEAGADRYGPTVRVNLEAGRYLLATDYVKSQRARTLLSRLFADVFRKVDVLITPTLPAFPPVIGDVWVQSGGMREHVVDAFLRFCIPFNLAGLPAISIPGGIQDGLPVGIQLAAGAFQESTLLRVAHALESAIGFKATAPVEQLFSAPQAS